MLNLEEYNATFSVDLSKEEFERLKSIVLDDDNIDDIQSIVAVKQRTLEKVEFVPVVRCKDCKWFEEYTEDGVSEGIGFCTDPVFDVYNILKTDWFCADGERKDG